MKRIHVFQHVPFETPGCITDWAQDKGYGISFTRFYKGDPLPAINSIDWLVIMGGPMSVHDTAEYAWLINEKEFIGSAISAGKKIIGICLGSQLIADVLGAEVRKNVEKEIGWHKVYRTSESMGNDILDAIPDGAEVFHWHGETFDIPGSALHGVYSECCRNQAFLLNRNILGLQFHMEVTTSLLCGMIKNCRNELVPSAYVQDEKRICSGAAATVHNNSMMYDLLDRFDAG